VIKLLNANWSRLGTESIVIILSVLVALALDDWRDGRAERALEQHLLVTLKDDLTADLEELDSVLESAVVVGRASSFLLGEADEYLADEFGSSGLGISRLVEGSQRASDVTQEQAAISTLVGGIDFDLSDLTYQEMMSTGSLRVIRNNALRRQIARYYWFVQSFNITNSTAEAYRFDLLKALLRNGVAPGAINTEKLTDSIDDQEVRALIDQLGATARTLHDVHVTFIEQAEQLLAVVEAELGD
jgi:hypothetical protein